MSYSPSSTEFVGAREPLQSRSATTVYRNPAQATAARLVAPVWAVARGTAKMVAYVFYWQNVSHSIRQLSNLDDAMLKDIGVARGDIVSTVYKEAEAEWQRRWK